MDVVVKPVDVSSIEAIVVVAADENFVHVRQVTEPIHEVERFFFCAHHAEVAGMYYNISLGQIPKPPVAAVSIREM